MLKTEKQLENTLEDTPEEERSTKAPQLLPYMWKKGQSGNPKGRPAGKTMKEYARQMLECQTEEERQEFLHGLPKETIWKMAEGNPKQDNEINATVTTMSLSELFLKTQDDKQ